MNDSQLLFTDNAGNTSVIDLPAAPLSTITDNEDGTITHSNGAGGNTPIDICGIVADNCNASLALQDNTLTFTDNSGTSNPIDLPVSEVSVDPQTGVVTHTNGNGDSTPIDVCAIVADNCNAELSLQGNTLSFTDNAGVTSDLPLPVTSLSGLDSDGVLTFTNEENQDTQIQIRSQDGTNLLRQDSEGALILACDDIADCLPAPAEETLTTISGLNTDGELSYVDEDRQTTSIGILSQNMDNLIGQDTDGSLLLTCDDIAACVTSGGPETVTTVEPQLNGNGQLVYNNEESATDQQVQILSGDNDNLLAQGSDNGVTLTCETVVACALSQDDDQLLSTGEDGGIKVTCDDICSCQVPISALSAIADRNSAVLSASGEQGSVALPSTDGSSVQDVVSQSMSITNTNPVPMMVMVTFPGASADFEVNSAESVSWRAVPQILQTLDGTQINAPGYNADESNLRLTQVFNQGVLNQTHFEYAGSGYSNVITINPGQTLSYTRRFDFFVDNAGGDRAQLQLPQATMFAMPTAMSVCPSDEVACPPPVASGFTAPVTADRVSFDVSSTNPASDAVAHTLNSITVDGQVFADLMSPDGYEQNLASGAAGRTRIKLLSNSNEADLFVDQADFEAKALIAFQNTNLNHYQQLDNTDYTSSSYDLIFNTPLYTTAGVFIAVTERNGNNSQVVTALDSANQVLGSYTVVGSDDGPKDYLVPMEGTPAQGYKIGFNQNSNVAILPLDLISTPGDEISRIRISFTSTATGDGPDAKLFVIGDSSTQCAQPQAA